MIEMVGRGKELELRKEDEEKLKNFRKRKTAELVLYADADKEKGKLGNSAEEGKKDGDTSSSGREEAKKDEEDDVTEVPEVPKVEKTIGGFKLPFKMTIKKPAAKKAT